MTHCFGIVLAAGEGRRMGGPKALLEVDGSTLVEFHAARLAEVGCTSIAIVVRPDVADAVRGLLREHPGVRVAAVITSSQAESLAAGLRALHAGSRSQKDVIIVTPVDLMPPLAATYRTLLACLGDTTLAVTPVHAGRGGHPVVAYRALFAPYEVEPPQAPPPLRDVLAAVPSRRRVEVDDPRVLGDLDTPSDLHAFGGSRTP